MALVSIVVATTGCGVRRDLHQAALNAVAEAQDESTALEAEIRAGEEQRAGLEAEIRKRDAKTQEADRQRDQVLAEHAVLRSEMGRTGPKARNIPGAKGEVTSMLAEAEEALSEQRARREAAAARAEAQAALFTRLQGLIEEKRVAVRTVQDRVVLDLKQDLLFPTGSAELSGVAQEWLAKIGAALAQLPEASFQVAGHTDNEPITSDRYPSNWELSSARASAVVRALVAAGMEAKRLSAAGYGGHQPRADNGSPEGRALNRRLEVVMLP